jgi:DNA polymerase-3 subunit epsilon
MATGTLATGAPASPTTVQRSFDELGTPLAHVTFCVLDLETTGGHRAEDVITEIGAVKVRGGECLGTFQTLVNPGRAIPPRVSLLTGLTDMLVATAPRVESVLDSLLSFVGGSVLVGHNVGFDLAFLRAALSRDDRPRFEPVVVDTVALARRLLRDEVPDCRLGTLADRFRLDHRPTHRALDDALATTDLLHLLIERAAGLGVMGLDDLVALGKLAGHPQAAKLKLTTSLPRSPGVYLFRGHRDEVLYVGKATNLRQRVRSYFGSDDRRKIGPMVRETQSISHVQLPDPLSAAVVEQRLISRLLPRYTRAGTRADRYCYVRLDVDAAWPRLSVVRDASATGVHLGPLPSRAMASLVVEAIQTVAPLRRCSARLGRSYRPPPDATACSAAQLGVAQCPCAGAADAASYGRAVDIAVRALTGDAEPVQQALTARMADLGAMQRFEEAALVRDRLSALLGAARRHHLVEALREAGRTELRGAGVVWVVDSARLVDVRIDGSAAGALPVDAPDPPVTGRPLGRTQVDEALCLARHFEQHATTLQIVSCTGAWRFPVAFDDALPRLTRAPRR